MIKDKFKVLSIKHDMTSGSFFKT